MITVCAGHRILNTNNIKNKDTTKQTHNNKNKTAAAMAESSSKLALRFWRRRATNSACSVNTT